MTIAYSVAVIILALKNFVWLSKTFISSILKYKGLNLDFKLGHERM